MIHLSHDFTLGNLVTIATLIVVAIRLGEHIGHFEVAVSEYARLAARHYARMCAYEDRLQALLARGMELDRGTDDTDGRDR